MKNRICLAYSGGLDTSIILHWLVYEKNYDVITFSADIGQEIFNKNEIEKRAKNSGAEKVVIKDLKKELVEEFAFRAIKANAYYEDGYLLGTSIARPLIAKHQVEIAKIENCDILSHGATGKGNDQVRFELAYKALYHEAIIYSPWKDKEFLKSFKSREDMLKYAEKNKLDIHSQSKSFSLDDNLLHISHEGGILEDPFNSSHNILIKCSKETNSKLIEVEFEKGIPKKLFIDDKKINDSVEIFNSLNELSKKYCFGIIDIVENRFIGLKSRGVYYQGSLEVLHKAHIGLEATILDKKTFHHQLKLGFEIGKLIYEGRWFSSYLQSLFFYIDKVNENIDGSVKIFIRPNAFNIVARKPKNKSIYEKIKSSGSFKMINFEPEDAKGFINIAAIEDSWNI